MDPNVIAVSTGLVVGLGAVGFLLRRSLERYIAAAERVPPQEWFDDIEDTLKSLPSGARIERHLDLVVELQRSVGQIVVKIERMEGTQRDHEQRIRPLENGKRF